MAAIPLESMAKYGALGAQLGGLAGPMGAAAGAGLGALGGAAYEMFSSDPYQDRLAKRIRELEMQEAGLTPEEMAVYRQSMNAPAIEQAAAAKQQQLAALATQGASEGALFRNIQNQEEAVADRLGKTELALMAENEKAKLAQERELDMLYKEQAGLQEDAHRGSARPHRRAAER